MIPFCESRRGETKPRFLSVRHWILTDRSHRLVRPAQGHPEPGADPNGCAVQVWTALTRVLQPTEERRQVKMLSTIQIGRDKTTRQLLAPVPSPPCIPAHHISYAWDSRQRAAAPGSFDSSLCAATGSLDPGRGPQIHPATGTGEGWS